MSDPDTSSTASVSFGISLLSVGAFFFFFAGSIKSAFIGVGDPGPRAVPVTLSIVLMVGGIIEVGAYAVRGRPPKENGPLREIWIHTGNIKVIVFTLILLGYVAAVPFAFYTSTFVFGALTIWYLGARWWVAWLVSAAIDMVVWVLFVRLFLVPLPTLLETLYFYWGTS